MAAKTEIIYHGRITTVYQVLIREGVVRLEISVFGKEPFTLAFSSRAAAVKVAQLIDVTCID